MHHFAVTSGTGIKQPAACRTVGLRVVLADTFANFSCEGKDRSNGRVDPTYGNECMSSIDKLSMPAWVAANKHPAALLCASLALVLSATASAAEPPGSVEYQSAFADYRHFDAQALMVEWQQANDAIRDGAEGASHGMHDMQTPMAAPPATGDEPTPATPDEHQAHHQ